VTSRRRASVAIAFILALSIILPAAILWAFVANEGGIAHLDFEQVEGKELDQLNLPLIWRDYTKLLLPFLGLGLFMSAVVGLIEWRQRAYERRMQAHRHQAGPVE
jgi:hypothetical protein